MKLLKTKQLQCYHYMSVCNADAWYIAVLIYGREFKFYKIDRDEEAIENLIKIADSVIVSYYKNTVPVTIPLVVLRITIIAVKLTC